MQVAFQRRLRSPFRTLVSSPSRSRFFSSPAGGLDPLALGLRPLPLGLLTLDLLAHPLALAGCLHGLVVARRCRQWKHRPRNDYPAQMETIRRQPPPVAIGTRNRPIGGRAISVALQAEAVVHSVNARLEALDIPLVIRLPQLRELVHRKIESRIAIAGTKRLACRAAGTSSRTCVRSCCSCPRSAACPLSASRPGAGGTNRPSPGLSRLNARRNSDQRGDDHVGRRQGRYRRCSRDLDRRQLASRGGREIQNDVEAGRPCGGGVRSRRWRWLEPGEESEGKYKKKVNEDRQPNSAWLEAARPLSTPRRRPLRHPGRCGGPFQARKRCLGR